jgi:hypothetical protein
MNCLLCKMVHHPRVATIVCLFLLQSICQTVKLHRLQLLRALSIPHLTP